MTWTLSTPTAQGGYPTWPTLNSTGANKLTAIVFQGAGTIVSPDARGNIWVPRTMSQYAEYRIQIFDCLSPVSVGPGHVIEHSSGNVFTGFIFFSAWTSDVPYAFDGERANNDATFASTHALVGATAIAPSDDNAFILAAAFGGDGTGSGWSATNGFTVEATNVYGLSAYLNQSTAASVNPDLSWTSVSRWITTLAAYIPVPTTPNVPGTPTSTQTGSSTATTTWADNSSDETGFLVEIETPSGAGNWATAVGGTNPTAAGITSFSHTGLSASTQYRCRVRANGSSANSAFVVGNAFTTAAPPDVTPPTLTGSISSTAITSTSYTITSPTATDNVAVTGYQYALNGGAWVTIAGGLASANVVGRSPGTSDSVQMRAFDAVPNYSTPLSTTVNLLAGPSISSQPSSQAVTAPATATFSVTATGTGLSYQWQRQLVGLGAFNAIGGATSSSYTTPGTSVSGGNANNSDVYRCVVTDSGGVAVTSSGAVLTVNPGADTTSPSHSGTITVSALTTTSYTLTWPAATDNVAVTGYEYSVDGGSNYINAGNVLTTSVSGRTPYTVDAVRVRAYDAAGNRSAPALSVSVSLPAGVASVTTSPLENLSGSLHLGVLMRWSWFPNGRIGQLDGIRPVEGTSTTNGTTGVLTATGLPSGDGLIMTSLHGANRLLDTGHAQYLTAV